MSIYSATRSVPRRWIRAAGEPPFCSCRGTWRRRELGDTLVDELALLQGPGGERERLGRRCPWQRRTADAGVPPKVLWRWRCRAPGRAVVLWRGGECVARFCSVGQDRGATRRLVCAAAICALWARPVHARDVLDEMLWHVRGLQTTRKLAGWGYSLRQNHWTCWFGQVAKFTVQTKTHVKTDNAHKVFDKMPEALRHFLE